MHLIIRDSGLGGLSICAAIARGLAASDTRITYVNAWPEEGRGYNDLEDTPARARMFERVLRAIARISPDLVLIACNTLSIIYEAIDPNRRPELRVQGIIDAGVSLFVEALAAKPGSSILLLGTRTTIESGVHRQRLVERGTAAGRIAAVSCHGLAAAIERGPRSAATAALIDGCAERAASQAPAGDPLYLGFCCTHYAFVSEQIRAAFARRIGRPASPLDPNTRMVDDALAAIHAPGGCGRVSIEVISKVVLEDASRIAVAALVQPVSPETASAVRGYNHVPDLF